MDGYGFEPSSRTVDILTGNVVDFTFTGTVLPVYHSITGSILDSMGNTMSNVSVLITGDVASSITTSDVGMYTFINLPDKGNFKVIPEKEGYKFEPQSRSVNNLTSDLTDINFVATILPEYSISGYIFDTKGTPLTDVEVKLSGDLQEVMTNENDGSFVFMGLPGDGSYIVAPEKEKYGFEPPKRSTLTLTNNILNYVFIGDLLPVYYDISGYILDSQGTELGDVQVILSGDVESSTTTANDGSMNFEKLPERGEYTVVPIKEGYVFEPPSRTVAALSNDVENFIFVAYKLGVEENNLFEMGFELEDNFIVIGSIEGKGTVNPDRGETAKIFFDGAGVGEYECRIFTLAGEFVWGDVMMDVDRGVFEWDADVASGTYIVNVKGPGLDATKKIIVIR
jgi:plastocyanin